MEVKTIAVIGGGEVGREVARAALLGGYRAVLEDVSPEVLQEAIHWIKRSFNESDSPSELSTLLRLATASNVNDAIREADLIIEAVPDELEMKLELFTIFDKFAKPGSIFASATSAHSIGDFSDVTVCRERCIGMRFSLAPPKERIVELVKTPFTSDETFETCREVARRMGKEMV